MRATVGRRVGFPSREPLGFTSSFWKRNDSSRRRVARRHDALRIHLSRLAPQTATRPPRVTYSITAQDNPMVKSFFRGKIDECRSRIRTPCRTRFAGRVAQSSRIGCWKAWNSRTEPQSPTLGLSKPNTDWRSTVLARSPLFRPTRFSVRSAVPPSHEDLVSRTSPIRVGGGRSMPKTGSSRCSRRRSASRRYHC